MTEFNHVFDFLGHLPSAIAIDLALAVADSGT